MAAAPVTASPNSNPEFVPTSFNSSYGEIVMEASVGSVTEHLPLSQEETVEGNAANSVMFGRPPHHLDDSDYDDIDTQFPMEDEDPSEVVRQKPLTLHNENLPVPATSPPASESGSNSTVTSGRATPCTPIEEESKLMHTCSGVHINIM